MQAAPRADAQRAERSLRRRVRQLQECQRREDRELLANLACCAEAGQAACDDGPPPRMD